MTSKDVLQRLNDSSNHLKANAVQRCIDNANSNLRRLWKHIRSMEDGDYSNDDMDPSGFSDDE